MSDSTREVKVMVCLTCSETKAWPDAFPSAISSGACWRCHWLEHVRTKHAKTARRYLREIRRRAGRRADVELERHTYGDDRILLQLANGTAVVPPPNQEADRDQ